MDKRIAILAMIGLLALPATVMAWMGQPSPNYNTTVHQEVLDALESGNYQQWLAVREKYGLRGRIANVITEENFGLYRDMHNAIMSGDMEKAMEIREELGLGQGNGKMFARGQGKHGGFRRRNFVDSDGDGICDNRVGQ